MHRIMRKVLVLLIIGLIVSGCSPAGPSSIDTASDKFTTLAEKAAFLEKYVTFQRMYQQLDYRIIYHNNSGGVPGPSEWDVMIIAQVPSAEVQLWSLNLIPCTKPDTDWLRGIATQIDYSGVSEWFQSGGVIVGIDRKKSVVVYRNKTM